jgi:hypothetical protein
MLTPASIPEVTALRSMIFMLVLAIAVVYMHDITPSTLVVILKNYNGSVRILNNSLHLVFCIR